MAQYNVPPLKQMPTQFKRMQRQITQLHASTSKTNGISWTLAAYSNGWLPSATGNDLFYEFTPDGNFVYMSGTLLVPSGVSNPSVVATIAPECAPVRVQSITAFKVTGSGNPSGVLVTVDTSGNVNALGAFAAADILWISGSYPITAQPSL